MDIFLLRFEGMLDREDLTERSYRNFNITTQLLYHYIIFITRNNDVGRTIIMKESASNRQIKHGI